MKLSSFISTAQTRLVASGVDNPALDARLLVGHALQLDRAALLAQGERELSEKEIAAIDALITHREKREPVGRILGVREFWGLPFSLNEATLEPRPDSETLVEAALAFLSSPSVIPAKAECKTTPSTTTVIASEAKQSSPQPSTSDASGTLRTGLPRFARNDASGENALCPRLLDLGTGTGCLLLSLLHEIPNATGHGIDIAPRAVQQAQENAAALGLADRATFQTGNWLDGLKETFDLIICNPPYIDAATIETLEPEVRLFDPIKALDGGADGFDPYRHLIPLLPAFLNPNGAAFFEVGLGQADIVAELMENAGFLGIAQHNDLAKIPRCVSGHKANS